MTQPINLIQNWFQTHSKYKVLSYLPAILWAGLIFWFSSQPYLPKLTTPWSEFLWKKTAHFLIFGGLYFWLWWSKKVTFSPNSPKLFNSTKTSLWWLFFVCVYAVSDEFHQIYVVNRTPSWTDIGIDALGAITFALALWHYPAWPKFLVRATRWLIPAYS